ncbi:hypothetical protein C9374_005308 [Naegleria lovaniensis]|uniref:CID domain-containing protein n=1 Tax=Naegleria lovaniensis TaxID=51637 RepID=A0AA88KK99_NAELO|nr:uncharacterized protein C9374_005308 [Naegleria lovaniensis]KAG2382728.1 hypothetical protein C9374_005308 [Naegleria lovaniensis]
MNEKVFVDKLDKLTNTQQSIQSLSLWVIYHAKRAKEIVQIWLREVKKAAPKRKLCYFYLANDVIQNSRKKTQAFVDEFQHVLPVALRDNINMIPQNEQKSLQRMFNVLEERKIFTSDFSKECKRIIEGALDGSTSSVQTSSVHAVGDSISSSSLKRDRQVAFGSPQIDSTIASKPIVKTLTQLNEIMESNRLDQKSFTDNDKLISECKQKVLDRPDIGEDSLANMSPFTLKQLQSDVESMITKCTDYKFALAKENNKRREYIQQLEQELKEQQDLMDKCNDCIKEWNNNYIVDLQKVSTSVEIHLNNKRLGTSSNATSAFSSHDEDPLASTVYTDDFFRVDEDEEAVESSNKKLKMETPFDEEEDLFSEVKQRTATAAPLTASDVNSLMSSILSAIGSTKNANGSTGNGASGNSTSNEYDATSSDYPPFD